MFVDEVTALTPETAFDVEYLRSEPLVEEEDWSHLDELIIKRRKLRRER